MKNSETSGQKTNILNCARKCFTENGYKETTIRDIAREAGISPSAIYIYFKNKKDLFDALDIPEVAGIRPEYERNKAELLQTALILFGEKGFDAVTMDDIASKQKISKSSLYQYCSGKEDLFSQVLQNSSFNLYTQEIASSPNDLDIQDVIMSVGRSYLQISDTPNRLAIFKSVIRSSDKFPAIGSLYYEHGIKPACNNIVKYVNLYGEQNNKPQPDSKKLFSFVLTYIGTLQSYLLMHDVIGEFPKDIDKESYLQITTDIFLNYLKSNDYI